MLFVSSPIGEATGTRRSCSPPRAEARSRGGAAAERSELALEGAASGLPAPVDLQVLGTNTAGVGEMDEEAVAAVAAPASIQLWRCSGSRSG